MKGGEDLIQLIVLLTLNFTIFMGGINNLMISDFFKALVKTKTAHDDLIQQRENLLESWKE